MAQFSLSWDAYRQNICQGLTALQQNGEFVDMTIAADGHHVKVHQMVMSLVSPYIKDLITSAKCPHPVILLNKVSYATLLSILEYIYTGEVIVDKDNMAELIQAGRELHIKGLEDMKIEIATQNLSQAAFAKIKTDEGQPLAKRGFFTAKENEPNIVQSEVPQPKVKRKKTGSPIEETFYTEIDEINDNTFDDAIDMDQEADTTVIGTKEKYGRNIETNTQYTISNQGCIQMILNRYMYNLRYTSVRDRGNRRWQCVNNKRGRCKAQVFTKDGVVVHRSAAHNHPFHDQQILKKVQANLVYSALNDVKSVIKRKKQDTKEDKIIITTTKNNDTEETTDAE